MDGLGRKDFSYTFEPLWQVAGGRLLTALLGGLLAFIPWYIVLLGFKSLSTRGRLWQVGSVLIAVVLAVGLVRQWYVTESYSLSHGPSGPIASPGPLLTEALGVVTAAARREAEMRKDRELRGRLGLETAAANREGRVSVATREAWRYTGETCLSFLQVNRETGKQLLDCDDEDVYVTVMERDANGILAVSWRCREDDFNHGAHRCERRWNPANAR